MFTNLTFAYIVQMYKLNENLSQASTKPGFTLLRSSTTFRSQHDDQTSVKEFTYAPPKPRPASYPRLNTTKQFKFMDNDILGGDSALWLPKCIEAFITLSKCLQTDQKRSIATSKGVGFFLDDLAMSSYTQFQCPQLVLEEEKNALQQNSDFSLNKGYLEKLSCIYYAIQKKVYIYRITKDLNFFEPIQLMFSDPVSQIFCCNIKSNNIHKQLKNVLLIVHPDKLSVYETRIILDRLQVYPMNIEISMKETIGQKFVITKQGDLFYLDHKSNLNQIMDQKGWFRKSSFQLKKYNPSVHSKIISNIKQSFNQSPLGFVKSYLKAAKNQYCSWIKFTPYPMQLLVDESKRSIFTLTLFKCQMSSYLQISLYRYTDHIQLIKTITEPDIFNFVNSKGSFIGADPLVLKLAIPNKQYIPNSNLQLQLISGIRIFLFINKQLLELIKIEYPPDFNLIIKNPTDLVVTKPYFCAEDLQEKFSDKSLIQTLTFKDRYVTLYYNQKQMKLQSYIRHNGYKQSPTVSIIPWFSLLKQPESILITQINYQQISNPVLCKLLNNNSKKCKRNVYELSEQIYSEADFLLMLSNEFVQFSIKLRPLDILFSVLNYFDQTDCKRVLEEMTSKQISVQEVIIMLITIVCNQQYVYYLSSKVQNFLQLDFKRQNSILNQKNTITKSSSSTKLKQKTLYLLDWMISHYVSVNEQKASFSQRVPESVVFSSSMELYIKSLYSYTSRILHPIWNLASSQMTEQQNKIIINRLTELYQFILNNVRNTNIMIDTIKTFIIRTKQLLLIIPLISHFLHDNPCFSHLITMPSKYYEESLFKAIIRGELNPHTIWKQYRMLVTRQLMIMATIAINSQTKYNIREIQDNIQKIQELPKFFIEYLHDKKIEVKTKIKSKSNKCQYFTHKLNIIQDQINRCYLNDPKCISNLKVQQLIQQRKILRVKNYLFWYLTQHGQQVTSSQIQLMNKIQIKDFIERRCDKFSNMLFSLNYAYERKQKQDILNAFFIQNDHLNPEKMQQLTTMLMKNLQPKTVLLKNLCDNLINYRLPQSTFIVGPQGNFDKEAEVATSNWIFSILQSSGYEKGEIIRMGMASTSQQAQNYLKNPGKVMIGKRMMMYWMLSYVMLHINRRQNRRSVQQFRLVSDVFLTKMNKAKIVNHSVRQTMIALIKEL